MKLRKDTKSMLGRIPLTPMQVKDLTPASYNPRLMSKKARQGLSNSINMYGLLQPIIYNKTTSTVVGGHQRLYDLMSKGVLTTDVIIVDLPLSEEKKLNLTLNNPNIEGTYTDEVKDLLSEMAAEEKLDLNLDELENMDHLNTEDDDMDDLDHIPLGERKKKHEDQETKHSCPNCGFKW